MSQLPKTETRSFRDHWSGFIHDWQKQICKSLEKVDGKALFTTDEWDRVPGEAGAGSAGHRGGGGGITKVISGGRVFEKGGVNSLVVWGPVTEMMRSQLKIEGKSWFAC